MNNALYFDYNGSTPVHPEVAAAYSSCIETCFGNTAAGHPEGRRSHAEMMRAKAVIAAGIGAEPDQIWIGSGGTEMNNLALIGAAEAHGKQGHMVVSAIEHKSILNTVRYLEGRGWACTKVDADARGVVTPEAVSAAIQPNTFLVSLMLANNETGILQPVAEVGALCRERGILFHCDAVAALGKVPVNVEDIRADMLTFSSHKMYAPKGCGVLYVRDGVNISPLIHGCGSQRGRRGGTVNMAALVAFAKAFELLAASKLSDSVAMEAQRAGLWTKIKERIPDAQRNGEGPGLPNTLSIAVPGRCGTDLLARLGEQGICVSAGSAATDTPSHVLRSMGFSNERAGGSLRLSMGLYTTNAAIDVLVEALAKIVNGQPAPTF